MIFHLIAISLAVLLDRLIGDPPHWPHPVKWMGKTIAFLEKPLNHNGARKAKGVVMVLILLGIVTLLSGCFIWLSYQVHSFVGIGVEAILIATTISRRSLKEAALEVYEPLKEGNLEAARLKLSYIVGRDTENLGEGEIVRGTVETVAENTSDGVTAPLFWALIGGAPLALLYRAINTCDSMVGYKNEKYIDFGWASARLDDVVNWIPSRVTGVVMLMSHRPHYSHPKEAWSILFRDAKKHPSPNSGWTEAAVAAILGFQLGGINYYKGRISNRAKMGDAHTPLQKQHILDANNILTKTTLIFILILWIGGLLYELAFTWLQSSLFI